MFWFAESQVNFFSSNLASHLYSLNLVLSFKLSVDPVYNERLIDLIWLGTNPSKALQFKTETGPDSGENFLKLVILLIKTEFRKQVNLGCQYVEV